jgi:segregation and condensation protein B
MEWHLEKETALIEAILFMETEPRDEATLAQISELSREVVEEALERLREKYSAQDSGLQITEISGGWLLNPKQDFWDFLKDRYGKKNEGRLSRAAMETLAIVAWSQPITRAEIEAIRGVAADTMLRLLLERELIKEVGKKDIPGKPVQYGTTREFLKFFQLNSIADLPKLDEAEQDRFELAR